MEGQIPGVHNYCDRWCERCPFTSRCAVFEMDKDLPPEAFDPTNELFAATLSARFSGALALLEEAAAEWDIVIEEPTAEEAAAYAAQEAAIEAQLAANALLQACEAYADTVELLFSESDAWEGRGRELARAAALGIKTLDQGMEEIDLLADCQRVLNWYQHFIAAKFRRALRGLLEDPEQELGPQSDANGSAKVALVAVGRSRIALTTLLQLLPGEDRVLGLLALLERIERLGREHFPGADSFLRPGFDKPAD